MNFAMPTKIQETKNSKDNVEYRVLKSSLGGGPHGLGTSILLLIL